MNNENIVIDIENCYETKPYCSHFCWFGSESGIKYLLSGKKIMEILKKENKTKTDDYRHFLYQDFLIYRFSIHFKSSLISFC